MGFSSPDRSRGGYVCPSLYVVPETRNGDVHVGYSTVPSRFQ